MLTVRENLAIIFIILNVAVKNSPYAEKSTSYTDQINVYPILYPQDPSELQLKINWQKTNLKDETINIDVKPLDNDLYYCQGSTCYEYGLFPNISEIALPKHPSPLVEYHECPIKPACHYNIRIVSSNNTISVDYTYAVPDCVENICSCAHENSISSVALSAKVNTLNTVLLEWNIPDSLTLPKSVYYENITIEVSKHQVTSLTWGGPLELLATSVIILHRKGEYIRNSTEILHLAEFLAPGERIDVSAHILDNRGCAGPMSKTVANVPEPPVVQTKSQTSPNNDLWLLQFIIPLVFIVIIAAAVTTWIIRRIKKNSEIDNWRGVYRNVTRNSMANVIMEDNLLYTDNDILEARARGEADYFEIPHSCLRLGSEIGKGAFGRVLIARADNLGGRPGKQLVAVKQLKRRPTNNELEEFLDEIATLKKVGKHPNIVNLLGCCTIKQPLLMIMEYVGCGDLLQYLRTLRQKHEEKLARITGEVRSIENFSRNSNSLSSHGLNGKYIDIIHSSNSNTTTSEGSYITQPDTQPSHASQLRPSVSETTYTLLSDNDGSAVLNPLEYVLNHNELHSFAIQIARGMKHLEDKQITHRDLAARNVLIDNNRTLKISDFGLSRSGIYVNTKTKKVPLRWLSVEAMRDNLYSSKSDVWAFGIVLWEIGTLGGFPYPSITNHELLPFLVSGQRLDRPENCSEKLYEIMKQCWAEKPEVRPSFQDLVFKLEPQQQKIYIDFDELSSDYVFPPTNVELNPKP